MDACCLGKKAGVVVKVEYAGQETALLENGGDVAVGASMAGVKVDQFRGSGGGAGGRRWNLASSFLDQIGNVDAVVWEDVICIAGVVPLDVCELAKIGQVGVVETAVDKKFCHIGVLRFVVCGQLFSVKIKPICCCGESWRKRGEGGRHGGDGRRSAGMLGYSAWDMFVIWLWSVACRAVS